MQTEPQVVEVATPISLKEISGEIRFKHVTYRYKNGPEVLSDFNLMIKSGQRVAIVGPSGHGKSTLLQLLVRFYDPQQGEILLDSVPIRKLSFAQLRESIGYVSQETYLFGDTIRNNILFGHPTRQRKT
ncbi:ABC transporter ATP-binding protein [Paenibacillus amylolyticus]|nr:ABC transporter ATP-binding protein [Paenibacillus amylolyticus]